MLFRKTAVISTVCLVCYGFDFASQCISYAGNTFLCLYTGGRTFHLSHQNFLFYTSQKFRLKDRIFWRMNLPSRYGFHPDSNCQKSSIQIFFKLKTQRIFLPEFYHKYLLFPDFRGPMIHPHNIIIHLPCIFNSCNKIVILFFIFLVLPFLWKLFY